MKKYWTENFFLQNFKSEVQDLIRIFNPFLVHIQITQRYDHLCCFQNQITFWLISTAQPGQFHITKMQVIIRISKSFLVHIQITNRYDHLCRFQNQITFWLISTAQPGHFHITKIQMYVQLAGPHSNFDMKISAHLDHNQIKLYQHI